VSGVGALGSGEKQLRDVSSFGVRGCPRGFHDPEIMRYLTPYGPSLTTTSPDHTSSRVVCLFLSTSVSLYLSSAFLMLPIHY
jgi:hypothetical protein